MKKDNLAIPGFGNNGMIQSVPSDPLLRSLTVTWSGPLIDEGGTELIGALNNVKGLEIYVSEP